MSTNVVVLKGNLGADPTLKSTSSGKKIANFSLAVDTVSDEPLWIRVVSFDALADTVGKYLQKGSQVNVTGRLASRSYTLEGGQKVTVIEVVANQIDFLSRIKSQDADVAA